MRVEVTSLAAVQDFMSKQPDPSERLAQDQSAALFLTVAAGSPTADKLLLQSGRRLVVLECGHFTWTKARHQTKCRRCGEMIRTGYDYEAFRVQGEPDDFSWPEDPLREIHERDV